MSEAQRLAARRAVEGLGVRPDQFLIDGKWDFIGGGMTTMIVKGDATCLSISAASILAKVTRDRMMRIEDEHYPAYDFAWNKGYPCPRHKQALRGSDRRPSTAGAGPSWTTSPGPARCATTARTRRAPSSTTRHRPCPHASRPPPSSPDSTRSEPLLPRVGRSTPSP
ncbi:hypothetical protein ACE2AJ_04540 [Aquihabitans daechungensis]|uniref:hypothetical protein n=1 Tax=Aquihabitans daechungensis TaxID=1052257 RepID=UPI003B9DF1D3